ncbi:hypothetical protein [Bacillus pseudomycoides]|uniref:hypothetical protein n=1 Tax=Bacillus pseudomycoides TaxID=64104 RepID=UPI001482B1FD|nr:hypothetical protein [Bacillus pseudomycoides]
MSYSVSELFLFAFFMIVLSFIIVTSWFSKSKIVKVLLGCFLMVLTCSLYFIFNQP